MVQPGEGNHLKKLYSPFSALQLRANTDFVDRLGNRRYTGEEWIFNQPGAYLPLIGETVVGIVQPLILTDKKAWHLQAVHQFIDE